MAINGSDPRPDSGQGKTEKSICHTCGGSGQEVDAHAVVPAHGPDDVQPATAAGNHRSDSGRLCG
ncbi:hypothetical protein CO058_01755 [candidate division WWE3 bacterium CG_4_9_14_0_2_um_filter_35_11]|uniref:Uncharacterized protein n=1 Tax=candidate division WWE3 bacterium CG_4_9_14_0_2_um_filter_35_11 TaxID=1975077 RepID=A0A2M8EM03_UNCKA|nr:MAG: hypothetical protein COV25_03790 [candidate division WWE3 bacterium CG10_big_fil_rev_8_21_14_0_10_35_32]PJC23750.1 MAG: hypothetical protein CO058_01755 [candidate division WWE3 bacterium CG_4_9_14_0_2_um_filter_35_11]